MITEEKTPELDQAAVAAALHKTCSAWRPAEQVELTIARFPAFRGNDGKWHRATRGEVVTMTLAEWVASRQEAALRPWPEPSEKESLPAEMGALLSPDKDDPRGRPRRRLADVQGLTWVFVDCDNGTSPNVLAESLIRLKVAFLISESATSRWEGRPGKWHLYLPLEKPATLPSRNQHDVDAAASLREAAAWWRRVHRHVTRCLFTLGGIAMPDDGEADDSTARDLNRFAYVPHAPTEDARRYLRGMPDAGGRLLDLDGFLRETAFDEARPRLVYLDPSRPAAQAPAEPAELEPDDQGDDGGTTAGETTGSLVFQALDFFGLVGPRHDENSFKALCPWRENHTPSAKHDPNNFGPDDDSVLVYVKGSMAGESGGFKCFHNGHGIAGQCDRATAADVLRWARRHGCPLPDRPEWGGKARAAAVEAPQAEASPPAETAPTATPEAKEAKPAKLLPPEFPGSPREGEPAPRPTSSWSPPLARSQRFEIEICDEISTMRDAAIRALGMHPRFFQKESKLFDLVEPPSEEDRNGLPARPWLRKSVSAHVKAELDKVSRWVKPVAHKGGVAMDSARPDDTAVSALLAAGEYPGVRELNGIITTPVFRRSGTLLQRQGYDAELGVLYRPVGIGVPPISPNPGRAELSAAKARLITLLDDFPFEDPELARGVWLAAIFTRLCRFYFRGNVPMFLVGAGQRSSGKGKLVDAATIISEGFPSAKLSIKADDAELDRVIGSAASDEIPVAVLDNIPRDVVLKSAAFEAYLTTPVFKTRRISTSDNISAVKGGWTDTLWWATGNALQTSGDMARRVLRIDIDDKTGRPEDRAVKIPQLENYCTVNRPALLGAALTLLCGFFAARRRGWRVELPTFASFEEWGIVREAVVWCGLPDPFLARGKASDDADGSIFPHLLEHLLDISDGREMRTGDYVAALKKDFASAKPRWKAAWTFLVDADVKLEAPSDGAAKSLGALLKKFVGQTGSARGRMWQIKRHRDGEGQKVRLVAVG